jgi:hypothetical protein
VDRWSTSGWPQYLGREYSSYIMLDADTLINGSEYAQVFDHQLTYIAAVRDVEGEVMVVPEGSDEEFLLYDFSLPVGVDTVLNVWLLDHGMEHGVYMRSDGPIGEDGRVVVQSLDGGYSWIEGVGCTAGLFMEPWINVSGYWLGLECMSISDSIHYPETIPGACVITTGMSGPLVDQPFIHPVPANDILYVEQGIERPSSYAVRTLDGRVLISGIVAGRDGTIAIETLASGAYVLELTQQPWIRRTTFVKC